jgi:hypothetical protein
MWAPNAIMRANPEWSLMRLVIIVAAALSAALLAGCAEPLAPASTDPVTSAHLRRGRNDVGTVPDSVGVWPLPVYPIPVELLPEAP